MLPLFVILEHDHPIPHWDLMIEVGEVLWTWRLDAVPQIGRTLTATRIPDHRLLYLDYEGPIQGDRGVVRRWDRGGCTWLEQTPTRLLLSLRGTKCDGLLELHHLMAENWEAQFHPSAG